jgi:hypothetical protein
LLIAINKSVLHLDGTIQHGLVHGHWRPSGPQPAHRPMPVRVW